jgi:mRNA interferase MazF
MEPLDSERALVTLTPHSTSPWGTRFEVNLKKPFLRCRVFDVQNPVTIAEAKLTRELGVLTADELARVEDAVRTWLGL